MTHIVNATYYRLGFYRKWNSSWAAEKKLYLRYLNHDFILFQYLKLFMTMYTTQPDSKFRHVADAFKKDVTFNEEKDSDLSEGQKLIVADHVIVNPFKEIKITFSHATILRQNRLIIRVFLSDYIYNLKYNKLITRTNLKKSLVRSKKKVKRKIKIFRRYILKKLFKKQLKRNRSKKNKFQDQKYQNRVKTRKYKYNIKSKPHNYKANFKEKKYKKDRSRIKSKSKSLVLRKIFYKKKLKNDIILYKKYLYHFLFEQMNLMYAHLYLKP